MDDPAGEYLRYSFIMFDKNIVRAEAKFNMGKTLLSDAD